MAKRLPKRSPFWWVIFLEGIIQLALGLLLLFSTDLTVFLLIQLLGIYWLIRGIIMIMLMFINKERNRVWLLLSGILGIIAGILVLRYPIFSSFLLLEFLVLLIAFVGLVQGTISFALGIIEESLGQLILGVVLWIVCMLLFFNPVSSVMALPIAIGIIWTIGGAVLTVTSLSSRK